MQLCGDLTSDCLSGFSDRVAIYLSEVPRDFFTLDFNGKLPKGLKRVLFAHGYQKEYNNAIEEEEAKGVFEFVVSMLEHMGIDVNYVNFS